MTRKDPLVIRASLISLFFWVGLAGFLLYLCVRLVVPWLDKYEAHVAGTTTIDNHCGLTD